MSLQEQFSNNRWHKAPDTMAYGSDVERAIFGVPALKEKNIGYISFEQALELVRQNQPDPMRRSRVVKDLRAMVADACIDTATPVKFFTAIGTPLDIYHGVDAFFEQGHNIVSIDISMREKDEHKADVLLLASLDKNGSAKVSPQEIQGAAHQIAAQLNEKLRRNA